MDWTESSIMYINFPYLIANADAFHAQTTGDG